MHTAESTHCIDIHPITCGTTLQMVDAGRSQMVLRPDFFAVRDSSILLTHYITILHFCSGGPIVICWDSLDYPLPRCVFPFFSYTLLSTSLCFPPSFLPLQLSHPTSAFAHSHSICFNHHLLIVIFHTHVLMRLLHLLLSFALILLLHFSAVRCSVSPLTLNLCCHHFFPGTLLTRDSFSFYLFLCFSLSL